MHIPSPVTVGNAILALLVLITVLCALFPRFAYKLRMGALYAYIATMSVVILPIMAINGRNVDNLKWLCRGMRPGRWLFGLSGKIIKSENMITDKPCVIVSNHQSTLDLFGMAEIFPDNATYLAKKELLFYGPLGLCFWLSGAVFIDRRGSGGRSVMKTCAKEVLDRNLKIWIFPEGTRSTKPGLLPFKKGAFNLAVAAQIPVVPVVFKSYAKFYNPIKHIFKPGQYVLEVLPAVSTEGLCSDDVPDLADQVRGSMLETYLRLSAPDDD